MRPPDLTARSLQHSYHFYLSKYSYPVQDPHVTFVDGYSSPELVTYEPSRGNDANITTRCTLWIRVTNHRPQTIGHRPVSCRPSTPWATTNRGPSVVNHDSLSTIKRVGVLQTYRRGGALSATSYGSGNATKTVCQRRG